MFIYLCIINYSFMYLSIYLFQGKKYQVSSTEAAESLRSGHGRGWMHLGAHFGAKGPRVPSNVSNISCLFDDQIKYKII